MTGEKCYIAIDLKSFYASVECAERGLDPLDANLVVADAARTDKTICLAVSPSLKAIGVPGRPRLFEAKQKLREENRKRLARAPGNRFTGSSIFASELKADHSLEADMVIAPPRMAYYMEYSRSIVGIYLRFISPDDLLVYSVDEVFIDATRYLPKYSLSARDFAMKLIREVLSETHITATVGIGTNMYLAKVAMDIVAKKMAPDEDGVRIAELDEKNYRKELWNHRPLTDFWRIGKGISRRLESHGMYTMGDVARCSEGKEGEYYSEDLLYRLFGVNAELIIDHAWGWEPTEISDCKAYVPDSKSLSSGQVLARPYSFEKAKLVLREMSDQLSLDLVRKGLVTDQVIISVGYDVSNLSREDGENSGAVAVDLYGRLMPRPSHGSKNLGRYTSSSSRILDAVSVLYDEITDRSMTVRRLNVAFMHLIPEGDAEKLLPRSEQLDLFTDYAETEREEAREKESDEKERKKQKALIEIRDRFGKNSIFRGMNMQEGATAIERNGQIGGHRA